MSDWQLRPRAIERSLGSGARRTLALAGVVLVASCGNKAAGTDAGVDAGTDAAAIDAAADRHGLARRIPVHTLIETNRALHEAFEIAALIASGTVAEAG